MRRIALLLVAVFVCAGCASLKYKYQNPPWFEAIPSENTQVVRVIPVAGSAFSAELTGWEFRDGMWYLMMGPWKAVVGERGFSALDAKSEGDKTTPSGLFPVRRAFGRYPFCPSRLPYMRMQEDHVWIDDPASPKYNTLARISGKTTYEKMLRDDGLYDYGAVIEYNTLDVQPGKGSAIFLHVWRADGTAPTAGCVAVSRLHMRELLSWLSVNRKPVVLLGPAGIEDDLAKKDREGASAE